jgi:hypothetical protein
MYCPKCTAWNKSGSANCGHCGAPLAPQNGLPTPLPPTGNQPANQQVTPPQPPPQSHLHQAQPKHSPPVNMAPSPYYREGPHNSGKATWSLALGIFGSLCGMMGLILGVAGMIVGWLAIKEIEREPNRYTGKSMAWVGIFVSGIAILSFVASIFYMADVFNDIPKLFNEASVAVEQFEEQKTEHVEKPHVSAKVEIETSIVTALDSYKIDNNAWPMWGTESQGANGKLSSHDPAWSIPTFRVWNSISDAESFMTLTTPIAYMVEYPVDPYGGSLNSQATFGYYTIDGGWIVFSAGPDGVYDIDPLKMYDPSQDQPSTILLDRRYDPTNGAYSRGDIFFVSEDMDEYE